MDRPDGFESWSEECKRAFEELKAEWEAREEARRASESADEEARSTEQARDAAEEELRAARAESEANREWLDGYRNARRAKKREIDDRKDRRTRELGELARDLNQRFQNGQITEREARVEYDEAEAEHDAAVETLEQEYDDLSDERRRRRARNRELRDELRRLEREVEEARDSFEQARERAEDALDELEAKRSETDIVKDYFALIRRCGPQDPQPGGESIEVPLEDPPDEDDSGEEGEDELTPWQEAVRRYLMDLAPWFGYLFPADPPAFVGVGSDAQPASHVSQQQHLQEPRQDTITGFPIDDQPDGPTWKEGCIEFLWVQGTRPEVDPRLTSNPITRTVSRAMTDVNTIWGRCACVRFTTRVRVVTPAQLGNLWDRDNGIFVADERTRSVSKERMRSDYDNIVRGLLENEQCTAFLVVDGVAGGAGFARLGGKVGVVTIKRVGDQQGYGDTTAHELGHAVANIDHIVDESTDDEREHEHGELMWGEGCADYPDRERRRYDKLTEKDCTSMKEALRDTEDPCSEEPL